MHCSDEVYRIFGLKPQFGVTFDAYLNYAHPDDRDLILNAVKEVLKGKSYSIDNRIITANGEERIIHSEAELVFDENNIPVYAKGIVQDVTERKKAEKALAIFEAARKKEIHHRIKNNLQVVSSLLDLQAEKFRNKTHLGNAEVLEAFRESQDRIMSIALIHKELHESGEINELNFSLYLQKLATGLVQTYIIRNTKISLNLDIEENIFFEMDTAVPLGMIVNEIISNSLKYAFSGRDEVKIQIKLYRKENTIDENTGYVLFISDNGIGIPRNIDFENPDTLGLQLVNVLVEQIDGCMDLKRDNGTEFTIWFNNIEK